MRLRWKLLFVWLLILFVLAVPAAFFGFLFAVSAGSDEGSPALAAEWKNELMTYDTPEAAKSQDSSIGVLKFENGEWLFGRAQNSHGIWRRGGGTLVVKDSRGESRAFLGGHVCGDGYLDWAFTGSTDLDSFYERVSQKGFTECDVK